MVKKVKEMGKSQKILVVDDDPSFTTALTPVLESRGYQVEAAYNKEEAMEKIEKSKPDLILLDIMMERLADGFDICYQLKHDPKLSEIPVLAVSAINKEIGFRFSPGTDGEYFQADDFLEKPVEPENLLERVEKLLKA
jgi:two-component system alkaline phosphatase synthesis response regulator PhoP